MTLYYVLYQFARAAVTKYHRPGALDNRNVCPHSSGGWKYTVQVWEDLVSPEASLLASSSCLLGCVLTWPFLCVSTSLVSLPPLRMTPVLLD